jgi:hypothetical protein
VLQYTVLQALFNGYGVVVLKQWLLALGGLLLVGLTVWGLTQPEWQPVLVDAYSPPKISTPSTQLNWGIIPMEQQLKRTIPISNHGGKLLLLGKVSSSCGCTVAKPEQTSLKAGSTTFLTITMDTSLKLGPITKTVDVTSNDPLTPKLSLTITGQVVPSPTASHHNGQVVVKDRLVLFKGTCKTCHVDKGVGKVGEELFMADCAMCHGINGAGGVAPSLLKLNYDDPTTRAYVNRIITDGAKNNPSMPPFGKHWGGPLSPEQIESVVNYLGFVASTQPAPKP